MFDKLNQGRQLLKMRSEAQKLQKQLAEVTETVEIGNAKVKVSADQKVIYAELSGERLPDVEKAVNEAFKKVQKKAAMKMMQEGDLSSIFNKLS
ncbi:hypothetical protein A2382_01640 [Candidatus Woesebacteria bacterium RIFOXYB1_FULL_38_16]|uniref:Nucleoid-associated protein, YbaB/EbfC family n=1 Tax=Candidatus Woesebacteria bacterium RIFOXYB1_FULL_38_16 TaxID=1802538 RepID=A0A1F8CVM9_9BACT|nr:MAG: hypothetical protein A2191_03220 [Candidatus Woesebacteria bacterium RIFOXYA1_FULL_38_9]OGM80126.1 MAG: hypothetical protein A2382_01640 [Candidatus Woesebacteria bacterium RIFOXYB1_FULL_38_16]